MFFGIGIVSSFCPGFLVLLQSFTYNSCFWVIPFFIGKQRIKNTDGKNALSVNDYDWLLFWKAILVLVMEYLDGSFPLDERDEVKTRSILYYSTTDYTRPVG